MMTARAALSYMLIGAMLIANAWVWLEVVRG